MMKIQKKYLSFYLSACTLFTLLFLFACEKYEYSPYQTNNVKRPENLNAANINKLKMNEAADDDTVTVLFTGDSQRFYKSLEDLVAKTNAIPSVDMLILAGDISDFALLQEFLWVYERLEKLKMPYFCVIGNHDLTANGSDIYKEMFGPKNFTFSYKGYKFLFHDTNRPEYNFNGTVPDLEWLSAELKDETPNWFVGVSHVPPYDHDFDKQLEIPYKDLFSANPRFILSLNGHLHEGGDAYYYEDHVRYITSFSVNHNECILLKLYDGKISKEILTY